MLSVSILNREITETLPKCVENLSQRHIGTKRGNQTQHTTSEKKKPRKEKYVSSEDESCSSEIESNSSDTNSSKKDSTNPPALSRLQKNNRLTIDLNCALDVV